VGVSSLHDELSNSTIIFATTSKGIIFAATASDGAVAWRIQTKASGQLSKPILSSDAQALFVISASGMLIGLQSINGTWASLPPLIVRHQLSMSGFVASLSPIVFAAEVNSTLSTIVQAGTTEGRLVAFAFPGLAITAKPFPIPADELARAEATFQATPVYDAERGISYFGANDGCAHCHDTSNSDANVLLTFPVSFLFLWQICMLSGS